MIPPEIRRDHVLMALDAIDKGGIPRRREATGFEVLHDGKSYPPKYVISLAAKYATGTELEPSLFSGGDETNNFLKSLGMEIMPKTGPQIAEMIETVLNTYVAARDGEPFSRQHELWGIFQNLQSTFSQLEPVQRHPTVKVTWSVGKGRWAKVPWIAFLDTRETDTTQKGIYCVFLFREDMSGIYLTLNQGVTQPITERGVEGARATLRRKAREIRNQVNELGQQEFRLDGEIDLRAEPGLGAEYAASTIAYKFYEKGNVPRDEQIENDLEVVLSSYMNTISHADGRAERAWVFQASPQYYDIVGAIRTLQEQTWLVSQHREEIHVGDTVFMWEAGSNAGIAGIARVETEPNEILAKDDEKPFVRNEEKFAGLQPRVVLRILRVLRQRLTRKQLMIDETLRSLRVIANPRGTNFPVSPEQLRKLKELLGMDTTVLKWERGAPDSYDLVLQNPELVDQTQLTSLYEKFITTENKMQPEFNQYLKNDLRDWIQKLQNALSSGAYVTLSNWFLTSVEGLRSAERGKAAGELWDLMFLCRPEEFLFHVVRPNCADASS